MEVVSFNQYKRRIDILRLMFTGLTEPFFFHPFVVWSGIKGYWDLINNNKSWGEMTSQGFTKKVQPVAASVSSNLPARLNQSTPAKPTEEPKWVVEKYIMPILGKINNALSGAFSKFLSMALILGGLFLLGRLFELGYDYYKHGAATSFGLVLANALAKDLVFWITALGWMLPYLSIVSTSESWIGKSFFYINCYLFNTNSIVTFAVFCKHPCSLGSRPMGI